MIRTLVMAINSIGAINTISATHWEATIKYICEAIIALAAAYKLYKEGRKVK